MFHLIKGRFLNIINDFYSLISHVLFRVKVNDGKNIKRVLAVSLSTVAVITYVFFFLVDPLTQKIEDQRSIMEQNIMMIHKMKSSEKAFVIWQKQNEHAGRKPVKNLSQFISESAVKNKIALKRIQVQNSNVQVFPEPLVFNELLNWLFVLKKESGIRVTYMDVKAAGNTGEVIVTRLEFEN